MSSFLPDVIVSQAVDKLHLKSPIDKATLNDEVQAGLERLYSFQHDDGGWGWWPDDESRVFMTAYVVSGLGQAKDAGYKVKEATTVQRRQWLQSALAAHPNMLADLRAYTVYALATTGGAPKDALDQAWDNRGKVSDEGLALIGLALDASGDGRANEAASLVEKKAKVTDSDAYWSGNYDELLDFWGDTAPETTAFAIKLMAREDRASGLAPQGCAVAGQKSRWRLLVLDQADLDGHPGTYRIPDSERRVSQHFGCRSARKRERAWASVTLALETDLLCHGRLRFQPRRRATAGR